MEPVQLSGTTVRHASLHNFDQVERLGVRIGDTVVVEKAGEIIPQVVDVYERLGKRRIDRPTQCPKCHGAVEQDEGGVYIRCVNPACPAQLLERLVHFVGRNQMDIDGAGRALMKTLVDKQWLRGFADVYVLKNRRADLVHLKGMGKKSVDRLLAGIEQSKGRPLARLLSALNIRHIGGSTAELLAEHFGSMDKLMDADEDQLLEVEGIGPEMAASILQFFASADGKKLICELKEAGVRMTQPKSRTVVHSPFAGKTLVLTGTLNTLGRKEAQALVKRLGGKTVGSVSSKTDFVVFGESPGSKLDKAKKLGLKTLDEKTFLRLAGQTS